MNEATLDMLNDKRDLEMKICNLLNAFQSKTGLALSDISFSCAPETGLDPGPVLSVDLEFTL